MTFWKRLLLPFSGLIALCGCSGVDILNFTIPRTGYTVHRDIAYGDNPRQKLDVYVPDKPAPGHPVIVFFYGGRWEMGTKGDYRFAGQAFASKGLTTVIADHRLYPEVYFPSFMEDGAKAFMWTHDHIREYGGNPEHLFLSGHSSGGYIAVMLTLNEHYLKEAGGRSAWIKGTIGIAGAYDFLPLTDADLKAIFSKYPAPDTQPIHYARAGLPPMLLLTGDQDTDVLPRNARNLTAKLQALGDPVTLRVYPGTAHIGIMLSLANGFRNKAPTLEDITMFIQQYSRDNK
jgi:acetyl esterase/lipase